MLALFFLYILDMTPCESFLFAKKWSLKFKKKKKIKLGFTPCKAEQPLRVMGLQEKEAQKSKSIQEICLERT